MYTSWYASEMNKLRFVYTIWGRPRDVPIQKVEIYNVKFKIIVFVPFVVDFRRNGTIG